MTPEVFTRFLRFVRERMLVSLQKRPEFRKRTPTPEDINCGFCAFFALAVARAVPQVKVPAWEGDDFGDHIFIEWNGRYYDATHVEGVDRWEDIVGIPVGAHDGKLYFMSGKRFVELYGG